MSWSRQPRAEAASLHKFQSLANMPDELRTPLNAVIGFFEVCSSGYRQLDVKQDEYLQDIYASSQHLLSLVNNILRIRRKKDGTTTMSWLDFDLPTAIERAPDPRPRTGRPQGIALHQAVDTSQTNPQAINRKSSSSCLNILSNALKFTQKADGIGVRAPPATRWRRSRVADSVTHRAEDQETVSRSSSRSGQQQRRSKAPGLGFLTLSRKPNGCPSRGSGSEPGQHWLNVNLQQTSTPS